MTNQWSENLTINLVLDRINESPQAIAARTQQFVEEFQARVGPSPWVIVDGPAWAGTPDNLTELVRSRTEKDSVGKPDPAEGYGFSLYVRFEHAALSVGVNLGGPWIGRRIPAQTVYGRVTGTVGEPLHPSMAEAFFEALVVAWEPLCASLTDSAVTIASGRGGWRIPAGYRVWLRDGTVKLERLADGVTHRSFVGGIILGVPNGSTPEEVAALLNETYDLNGVDTLPH